jgi:hypothetical protein
VENLKKKKMFRRRESFQEEEEEDLDDVENLEMEFVFLGSLLSEADAATH